MNPLIPLEGHGAEDLHGGWDIFPAFGGVLLLLLVMAAGAWLLWRRGLLRIPSWARPETPESSARRILAERFAHGDLSSEEFLDRASMINWTPGIEPAAKKRRLTRS